MADIYAQGGAATPGGPWYGPHGSLGPEPPELQTLRPPMPIKPRHERGHRWLRYAAAAALLALVVGGSAFAITRILDRGSDEPGVPTVAGVTGAAEEPAAGDAVDATPESQAPTPTPTEQPIEPTPTSDAAAAAAVTTPPAEPTPATTPPSNQTTGAVTVRTASEYLPDASALSGEWVVNTEGERSRADVASQLGADGEQLLLSWRWRENVFRDFNRQNPQQFADDATFVSVSVHRFASQEGAAAALEYLADIVVAAQGLQDIGEIGIGDRSRALEGPGEGANLYVLYVQDGNYVLRLGGSSVTGDPSDFVDDLAAQLIDR